MDNLFCKICGDCKRIESEYNQRLAELNKDYQALKHDICNENSKNKKVYDFLQTFNDETNSVIEYINTDYTHTKSNMTSSI